jgi:hypothetical protein
LHYPAEEEVLLPDKDLFPLPDGEGRISLLGQDGQVIDEVSYTDGLHSPMLTSTEGVSLERTMPGGRSNDPTNWQSAARMAGFATPGYQNSQFRKESEGDGNFSVVKELFSPDGDGQHDIFYLDYKVDKPGYSCTAMIFDSRGRLVKRLLENATLGMHGSIDWDGTDENGRPAPMGIYTIFIRTFHPDGDVKVYKKTCVLARKLR